MRPPGKDDTASDLEWIQLPESADVCDEDCEFELMPENLKAYELFLACSTQWICGMAGPVGLNYPSVESVMRMNNFSRKQREDVFWRVRCIERGALAGMGEKDNG